MGQIVNQELMTELGVSFSLGADILSKGNRTVEKLLGADKMSGDTVSVTINGTGKVYENTLDISSLKGKLGLQRGSVPVRVRPIGIATEVSEGELALAVKMPDAMDKFTAELQDTVNQKAYRHLIGASQAFVFGQGMTAAQINAMGSDEIERRIKQVAFDAEGNTTTSKFAGATQGIVHPQTWNRIVPSFMPNYGANNSIGEKLYKNELGPFLGFPWTKGMDTLRIEAQATGLTTITVGLDGELTAGLASIAGATGDSDGEIFPMPVYLKDGNGDYLTTVDALGKSTGWKKTFFFKWSVTSWDVDNLTPLTGEWVLANPIFLAGPRKNAHSKEFDAAVAAANLNDVRHGFIEPDYNWYAKNEWNRINATPAVVPPLTFTAEDVLTADVTYLAPMVMFKEPDFLIAVKGLEKRPGQESFTIPTKYTEKGIMPWRGTYWNDDYKSLSLFRVDALMGFGTYQGVSMSSVFIPFL